MNNLQKYKEIMNRYRNGEFGENPLSLHEILKLAGCPNLVNEMSEVELEDLSKESTGITKSLFLSIKNVKK